MTDEVTGRDFGRLEAQVSNLDTKIDRLLDSHERLETRLNELQGRPGKIMQSAFATIAGAIAATIVTLFGQHIR